MTKGSEGIWVVGYGSLIYKPPPHWKYKVNGIVYGFKRRFWQSSIDHRGTPDSPGRVATLIPFDGITNNAEFEKDLRTWNSKVVAKQDDLKLLAVAYYIPPEHAQFVTEHLDVREKNGYTAHRIFIHLQPPKSEPLELQALLHKLPVHETTGKHILDSLVYIGTSDNEAFIGPEDINVTAKVISHNLGPSGPNYEYLKLLHDSLTEMADELGQSLEEIEDSYLDSLLKQTEQLRSIVQS
ncbi:gamma-glutamylcyclotransferase [Kluyveromyces lactis]|uniref:glutathione-specific gamma-glutamylcyclotransferase n=1 Tax=Kluyveromyces lactis (strain ATCC 8585 / CBS 2359 / DSM 70799 / NBRC 1267 / NRRL Y-1140 / WM37) TaxID=284590 RepID=Q6CTL9_KLULA|nr:uncharacterized protein KLLA0_C11649g [Kluyveromyces lactis]CAH01571.1 KLLA0C11649p [Kluyveromyces lactis]|eukprot:XP_452720.1 uncharacterized protein KLLA0_C11649g [Kluyveromyces lactis]